MEKSEPIVVCPLKRQKARALKSQDAVVSLGNHSVFPTAERQFHTVTAFYLKCDIVGMGGGGMVHTVVRVMMVVGGAAVRYDGRGDTQAGRGVVMKPFPDTPDQRYKKHCHDQQKDETKDQGENIEHKHIKHENTF